MTTQEPNQYLIYKNMPLIYDVFLSPDNKYLYVGFNSIYHVLDKYKRVKSQFLKKKLMIDYQDLSLFVNEKKVSFSWIGENTCQFLTMSILETTNFENIEVKVEIGKYNKNFTIPKRTDGHQYQDKIGAVLLFKNENEFLPQWIEYYDLLGVDFFFVYNNNPENQYNFKALKDKYQHRIIFTNWVFPYTLKGCPGFGSQLGCYHQSLYKYRNMKWILYNDIDEFVILRNQSRNLKEFLSPYNPDNISSLTMECMWFGCSNGVEYNEHNFLKKLTKTKGITESCKFKGTNLKYCIKSIHSPKNVISLGPHYPLKTLKPYVCLSPEIIRFNHYYTLSSWGKSRLKLTRDWSNQQKKGYRKVCDCQTLCQVENTEILDFYNKNNNKSNNPN